MVTRFDDIISPTKDKVGRVRGQRIGRGRVGGEAAKGELMTALVSPTRPRRRAEFCGKRCDAARRHTGRRAGGWQGGGVTEWMAERAAAGETKLLNENDTVRRCRPCSAAKLFSARHPPPWHRNFPAYTRS